MDSGDWKRKLNGTLMTLIEQICADQSNLPAGKAGLCYLRSIKGSQSK